MFVSFVYTSEILFHVEHAHAYTKVFVHPLIIKRLLLQIHSISVGRSEKFLSRISVIT